MKIHKGEDLLKKNAGSGKCEAFHTPALLEAPSTDFQGIMDEIETDLIEYMGFKIKPTDSLPQSVAAAVVMNGKVEAAIVTVHGGFLSNVEVTDGE